MSARRKSKFIFRECKQRMKGHARQTTWRVVQFAADTTAGTGAVKLHPAAARLDVLRRDLTKALALLGLQKSTPEGPEPKGR